MVIAPTSRWYPLRPHAEQARLWDSPARFNVVPAGRRSGKTEIAKRKAVRKALTPSPITDRRIVLAAPVWSQAKRLYWNDCKKLIPRWAYAGQDPRRATSESELTITLIDGTQVCIAGLDVPERIEGVPIDHIVLDEYGNCKADVWPEHVRPCLSERNGTADLIGCPEGRNHYYTMAMQAQEQQIERPDLWGFFTWPSSDILPAEEIEIARGELDARTFAQEYEASFLDVSGRVYYNFLREVHAAESLPYDPFATLMIGFDFNVAPGVCIFAQERLYRGDNPKVDRVDLIACVTDEIWVERDSNTPRVCQEIIRQYRDHHGPVEIYADASGGAGHTSQVDGSDLTLIRKYLSPVFGERLHWRVPHANPPVRARVNSLNSRLESADGKVHLLVDPSCKHVVQDLEGVTWAADGGIDKKTSRTLSHISDALGYLVHAEWPVSGHTVVVEQC